MSSSDAPPAATNGSPPAVDVLEEDIITVPGQLYALVSFVSPDGRQKSAQCGMKIRGVFNTRDEAAAHVKRLQRTDPLFDIYLLDLYKWVAIPPDPTKIDDHQYQESYLQDLVQNYRENQELAKKHFQERKEIVQTKGLAADPDASVPFPADDPHPSAAIAPDDKGKELAEASSSR